MAFGTKVRAEAVREAAFGSIGAAYAALGSALSDHCRIFSVFNSTDVDVYISFDGTTNHLRVASGTGQVYDLTANKVRDDGFFVPVGTVVYQKRVSGAPTTGAVWAQVVYADGGV